MYNQTANFSTLNLPISKDILFNRYQKQTQLPANTIFMIVVFYLVAREGRILVLGISPQKGCRTEGTFMEDSHPSWLLHFVAYLHLYLFAVSFDLFTVSFYISRVTFYISQTSFYLSTPTFYNFTKKKRFLPLRSSDRNLPVVEGTDTPAHYHSLFLHFNPFRMTFCGIGVIQPTVDPNLHFISYFYIS